MPPYVKRTCAKCNNVLENWTPNYITFGNPLIKCSKCGTIIKLDHVNEWELMSFWQKLIYIKAMIGTIFIYTAGSIIVWAAICVYIFNREDLLIQKNISEYSNILPYFTPITYLIIFFVLIISITYKIIKFKHALKESRIRMQNQEYRNIFINYGILEK